MLVTHYVTRLCDICEQPVPERSVKFGWELANYEIDLCPRHANELAGALEPFIAAARRLGNPPRSFQPDRPAVRARDVVSTHVVRDWAKKTDRLVSERGRLPDSLFEEYLNERYKTPTPTAKEK